MTTKHAANRGFTLVEIMIVVAIIGLLAASAIPNFIKARARSQANTCISNLRQIDSAVQRWAVENSKSGTDPVTPADIQGYFGRGVTGQLINVGVKCPAGGTYDVPDIASPPTCTVAGHELSN